MKRSLIYKKPSQKFGTFWRKSSEYQNNLICNKIKSNSSQKWYKLQQNLSLKSVILMSKCYESELIVQIDLYQLHSIYSNTH